MQHNVAVKKNPRKNGKMQHNVGVKKRKKEKEKTRKKAKNAA